MYIINPSNTDRSRNESGGHSRWEKVSCVLDLASNPASLVYQLQNRPSRPLVGLFHNEENVVYDVCYCKIISFSIYSFEKEIIS